MGIRSWLTKQHLGKFADTFEDNAITFAEVGSLTHEDLREGMGIKRFSERKALLKAIKTLRGEEVLEPKAIDYPEGLTPDAMPTYIAHPWHSLCVEDHPRVKLHWLTDTAELAVRWAVSVTLAEILFANDMKLPAKLAKQIRDNVERPTLGRWLGVLRELSQNAPSEPVMGMAAFKLYEETFETLFAGGNRGGTLENSLLVLRNQIAHGGGMSQTHAEELLGLHMPLIESLLHAVIDATGHAQIIAVESHEAHLLQGVSPQTIEFPKDLNSKKDGTWLIAEHKALPLLPLAIYGPVRMINSAGELQDKPGGAVAQVFTRAYHDRLSYTPLGRDEAHSEVLDVEVFREVFRLDEQLDIKEGGASIDGVRWDDALKEARAVAEDLVGRKDELGVVKGWLKSRTPYEEDAPRLGWISGGPGLGKSMLMARLASDYGAGAQRGFYFHKFSNAGNARSNRRMFLKFIETALWSWAPLRAICSQPNPEHEGDELMDAVEARLAKIAELEAPNPRAPRPAAWIFLDNFDEMIEQDPRFIDVVRRFALPGTVWLMCGRPEHGLDQVFGHDEMAELLFPGGVPMMSAPDMRAMLLEGLGQARYALLKRDEDDDEGTHNVFIENVVEKARGLPLYVELLLDDLRSGTLTVEDDDKLPDGLGAYYDGLMERIGLSTVSRDLPLIVSLLARAEEPMEVEALATLLAPILEDVPHYRSRVRAALRVGQSLLKTLNTPEHTEGYLLYHQSFREYIGGQPAAAGLPGGKPAARLLETVYEAERLLYRSAERWRELPGGNLRNHLFRWGTGYAIDLQGDSGLKEARHRLTDYHYLHARLDALRAGAAVDIVAEYNELLRRTPPGDEQAELLIWEAFLRERAHLMASDQHDGWPATRVMFQLAMEHADTSPITLAAEQWLAQNETAKQWLWLRKPGRPAKLKESFVRKVFAGHGDRVEGAHRIGAERLLSWSIDSTLKLWNFETGEEVSTLAGHAASVDGALLLDEETAISWSRDGGLKSWNMTRAELTQDFVGHEKSVLGVHRLDDTRLLSWAEDKTLRIWELGTGSQLACFKGHTRPLRGAMMCEDELAGHMLSWSDDRTLRLWDLAQEESLSVMKGHEREVLGAVMDGTTAISWGMDNTLRRWDVKSGEQLAAFEGHKDVPMGAMYIPGEDGAQQVLSWGKDGLILRWSIDGELLATWKGHKDWVDGVMLVGEDRALSWSKDKNAIWWNTVEGKVIQKLEGHAGWVRGATQLSTGEFLTWAGGGTIRVWDIKKREEEGAPEAQLLAVLEGHTAGVRGCEELQDGRLISWSWDGSLRVWEWSPEDDIHESTGHRGWIHAHKLWDEDRAVTWSSDASVIFWNVRTGDPLCVLEGHDKSVDGVDRLSDGKLLTWSGDMTLGVWDIEATERLATMEGHVKKVQGARQLQDGHIVSWSSDATIKIWDVTTGELLHDLGAHKKLVQGVREFAPGKLVSWSSDATIKIWDVATGELLHDLKEHKKLIKDLKMLDERRAISISSDNTARIWDLQDATCTHVLEGHKKLVQGVRVFAPNEVLTIGKDNCCIMWDVQEGTERWRVSDLPEVADGGAVLDEAHVVLWLKKASEFVVLGRADGVEVERVGMDEAMASRPDIWRARQQAGRFDTLHGPWRAQSAEQGAVLYEDDDTGTRVQHLMEWRDTGSWSAMGVHADGILTVHAGNYFHALQLHRGTARVTLDEAHSAKI